MEDRKISLFTDEQPNVAKKNIRDLIIGIVIFLVVTIFMAMNREGIIVTIFSGLACIAVPIFLISERLKEYHAARTEKSIGALVKKYGDYSTKIDDSCIDFMTLLFPSAQVIVIQGMLFKFSEIIDFSLNEMASYKTTKSTSSMLGIGIVVGVLFGGIGALAGANSATTNTEKENQKYKFNIILDDFNNPNFSCTYYSEDKANKLYSMLKLIIDKNQSRQTSQGSTII